MLGTGIPRLWRMQHERGPAPVLRRCLGLGAAIGFALSLLLIALNPRDPSGPAPTTAGFVLWVVVLTFIGTVNGAFVGSVTVLSRPKR